jgi:hypothetical protein
MTTTRHHPSMTTAEWIAHVDGLRRIDKWLTRGEWHGYTELDAARTPMKGKYYLVRWNSPTVATSHDEPESAVALARLVERAMADGL